MKADNALKLDLGMHDTTLSRVRANAKPLGTHSLIIIFVGGACQLGLMNSVATPRTSRAFRSYSSRAKSGNTEWVPVSTFVLLCAHNNFLGWY